MSNAFDRIKYGLSQIAENGRSLNWWRGTLMRRGNGAIQTKLYPGRRGIDVVDADWDTLVVLDACRADLFEEFVDLDQFDDYRAETSRASATPEWLPVSFPDEYGDIVYVSGNPQVSKKVPDKWHKLFEVWQDAYDDDVEAILPGPIIDAAIRAREEYPDKRLIVHLMQPHVPFVGRPDLHFCTYQLFEDLDMDGDDRAGNVFEAAAKGIVDEEEMWQAYGENLTYAMDEVQRLIDAFDERIVLTSDHGNVVEAKSWPLPFTYHQHLPYHRHPGLVTVPWAVLDGERPTITDDGVESSSRATSAEVTERLENLGYK
ncbi:hypothetical protein C5B91_06060 [Haloferax sp. Atlit-10N]|uniref:Uncharacterized protein n=1 Tax=Haloferax prahovense (strain DSM 18310 / JCM 13924 / TL6) TaxID=1227461 RepID=M0GFV8_HALPT|nr:MULTISPECIES: hypothetical protein [Haloferax]ELZ71156.1 hypothetical protein C457_07877 [Haloferax prahovense DSM 18310]RDZ45502.1 hypothetical protein C5B86_07050 [Haloferax sp. Atlit-19N]RDZ55452.1 hypothetical protein C5C07_08055 [Haloferax sp. Atlit-4N]RDZ61058.1 hypothetical protein C5B91_06060 [Haloferax sp. Atlit-10N]REA04898.1 hypothetical protein DEQ92_01035 [Haloferax sp. Atlit-6N]